MREIPKRQNSRYFLQPEALKDQAVRGQKRANIFAGAALILALAAIFASWFAYNSNVQVKEEQKKTKTNLAKAYEREIEQYNTDVSRFIRDKASFQRAGEDDLVKMADSLIEVYGFKIDSLGLEIDSLKIGLE